MTLKESPTVFSCASCAGKVCPCPLQSSRQEEVFDDNFAYFSLKLYVATPHLNCLVEMKEHNICLYVE